MSVCTERHICAPRSSHITHCAIEKQKKDKNQHAFIRYWRQRHKCKRDRRSRIILKKIQFFREPVDFDTV